MRNCLAPFNALALTAAAVLLFVGSVTGQQPAQSQEIAADLPTAAAIKACMSGEHSAECLDRLFHDALKKHSTLDALQLVQRLEATDTDLRRDCHPVVHAIGRETFLLKGNIHDSFSACDQTCQSGCYHGSVERFLRGDDLYAQTNQHPSQRELKQKAAIACDPKTALRFRYQCLHGLGHAIMFFATYNLPNSLEVCDALEDEWSRSSCYGGVFMENVSNSINEKKNFSPTDYHAPCNRLDAKYQRECYVMQTSRMSEMGLSAERILQECDKAGEYRVPCAQSLGRDLSNDSRLGEREAAAKKCELASGETRLACVRGVVYALIDNTWDGRYALPFCAVLGGAADQDNCFKESAEYLRGYFEKTAGDLNQECSRYVPEAQGCRLSAAPKTADSLH